MKTIGFLHYRAGSTLFQTLSGLPPAFIQKNSQVSRTQQLASVPVCPVAHIDCGQLLSFVKEQPTPSLTLTHLGNWWGNLPANQVPDPYEDPSPMKWSVKELSQFGDNHRFFTILRDGRDWVESVRKLSGGIEEQYHRANKNDYFVSLCKAYRNQTRIALDNATQLTQYRIFFYENLVQDPKAFMHMVMMFMNLELDKDRFKEKEQWLFKTGKHAQRKQSSFGSTTHTPRWSNWSNWQIDTFWSIAGKEALELGYDK